MSRHRHRARKRTATDSHPLHFSQLDLREMATERDKWLDHTNPLDCISVEVVRRCQSEAMRGAWAQMQWTWEQLEPADPILATCVERRLSALRRIPWDIVKKEGLSDAEDLLAEAQLRTLTDFANALENLDEGIAALAQASFRHFRHIQLYETELGTLRLNCTDNWNWCRDGYAGAWQWNPAATYGRTIGEPLPVAPGSIVSRLCARPIDLPAMMLCLDRKNAKAQWQVFNGRYGTPAVFAIMPQGISENMRADYIRFARQCISNAAGVLPHGSDVKTVQPGSSGPDTFARLLEVSTQELVLRATGGLMTMLTAPGAGTNTATGSAHQDAFDDLAAAEAEEIAAVLNEKLFAPVLDQWHPGQPHLVEFIMKRPDSDNAAGAVQNIVALAGAGYKTEAEQASGLTGLQLEYHPPSQQAAMAGQAESALNSLRVRFAPTMLYPPARAAFEAALNSKAKKPGFVGTESRSVYAEATPLRNSGESEPPLNAGELAALRALGGGIDPAQVAADAEYAAREMMAGLRGKQRRGRDVARNSEATNEAEFILEFESLEIQPGRDKAENCNQHGHDADCTVSITAENLRKTSAGKSLQGVMDELKANPAHPSDIPVTLNQANQRTAEKVQELCGRDISQHVHSISPSELHHARKGHPDLNDEEVMLMLDIHDNWDELTYEVRSNTPKLKYSKTYDGQSYTVVERIGRTPRTKGKTRHLHFTTEFKND
ncbi:MAG: DUF935 family protein [Akkermansia sp.]|nr:DUF935 family protein [Akkermansia sp.]